MILKKVVYCKRNLESAFPDAKLLEIKDEEKMTNFSDMLSKAKAMQEKMKEAQEKIKKIEVEGEVRRKIS